jgi:hypothetical protein
MRGGPPSKQRGSSSKLSGHMSYADYGPLGRALEGTSTSTWVSNGAG